MRNTFKKITYIAMAIIMTLLVVNIQPYASASAASDKTIAKKLKKNAWSPLANPDSAQVSRGYALYKIYNAIMDTGVYDDPNWKYIDKTEIWGKDYMDQYDFSKISASSKKQKKAVQWMLKKVELFDYKRVEGTLDCKEIITRREFCKMLSCVIESIFPCMLKTRDTGSSYIDQNGIKWSEAVDFYSQAIYKGFVVGGNLRLDDALTKEDLSRALKNFKIVIANRIQPVYREEKKEVIDYKELIESLSRFIDQHFFLTDKSYRGSDKFGRILFCGENWFKPTDSTITTNNQHRVGLTTGDGSVDSNCLIMDDRYVDVEATIKKILKERFIR